MTFTSKTEQCPLVSLAQSQSGDPLPSDPSGQRLCGIFGQYLWCSIYADVLVDSSLKVKWYTQGQFPLKSRVLWREWQEAARLVGVRPGHSTVYALLDIDIDSPYHPNQDEGAIAQIEAALETIGITRTLRIRSSWSEGIHLYIPLPDVVKTFDLAVALKNCLVPQGFQLKAGHLECFPNVKAYGNLIKTEYLAHRLPLQPESGSCLLDQNFNPGSSSLEDFFTQWDTAAAGQDFFTLKQALPLARQNRFKKVRNRLNKVDSWRQDLETVLVEGWTGTGQTNQLLKEMGCYGHVFLGHCDEALADFIYAQATSSPGYGKWCRHQREIKMRSRVWATAIEKYYWPLGTCGKDRQTTQSKVASFNTLRAQNAQESIQAAVQQLESINELPEKATARAQAVRKAQGDLGESSSSLETLYKDENKNLWHPDFYKGFCQEVEDKTPVISSEMGVCADQEDEKPQLLEGPQPFEHKELRTKGEIMKCERSEHDDSPSSKTKFNSGRGVRGEIKRFPQPETPQPETLQLKPVKDRVCIRQQSTSKVISEEIAATLTAIQNVVQRLSWSTQEIVSFIAERFQGRRRAQLSDEELLPLLYYLQIRYLETDKG